MTSTTIQDQLNTTTQGTTDSGAAPASTQNVARATVERPTVNTAHPTARTWAWIAGGMVAVAAASALGAAGVRAYESGRSVEPAAGSAVSAVVAEPPSGAVHGTAGSLHTQSGATITVTAGQPGTTDVVAVHAHGSAGSILTADGTQLVTPGRAATRP